MSIKRILVPSLLLTAVVVLVWWISTNTYFEEVSVPSPPRGEAVRNPHYAAQRMVESLGATSEWRQTLGTPPDDSAVLVLRHWHWSLIDKRRQDLEEWVRGGGRLILDRTLISGHDELRNFSGLTIDDLEQPDEDEDNTDEENEPTSFESAESIIEAMYGRGICESLRISHAQSSTDPRDRYNVCQMGYESAIVSDRPVYWGLLDDTHLQAARTEIGRGSVTLLNAEPFGNRDLLEVDHAALFVAVTQLKRGDHVVFLSEENHPSLLELIWDNGKPVVLLAALLILVALWRGAPRFGPLTAPAPTSRRSLAEQIRGTGIFTLQFDGSRTLHAAAVRALNRAARHRIPRYEQLAQEQRIAALAKATGLDGDKLAQAINYQGARHTHELQQALALIETARRQLSNRKTH